MISSGDESRYEANYDGSVAVPVPEDQVGPTTYYDQYGNEISEEEYNSFYKDKCGDYTDPLCRMHVRDEGTFTYDALLYIPSHTPFNYYSKDYEKGLQLYANGVLIMDRCEDLLPDYFIFVKGLVDSEDLSLNI